MITGLCSNCGEEIDADNYEVCPYCGHNFHPEWPFNEEETRKFIAIGLKRYCIEPGIWYT